MEANYFTILYWFCHTSTQIRPWVYTCSQSWTPLPPPSPYHPSGSSQCTSPKHPVSCIEPRLVIHFLYDIIHVSVPFSQIISPSPSPSESKSLLYTWLQYGDSSRKLSHRVEGFKYVGIHKAIFLYLILLISISIIRIFLVELLWYQRTWLFHTSFSWNPECLLLLFRLRFLFHR